MVSKCSIKAVWSINLFAKSSLLLWTFYLLLVGKTFGFFAFKKIFQGELENISKSLKYPVAFGTTDQAVFSIKLTKTLKRFRNCVPQSLLVHDSDDLPTFKPRKVFTTFKYGTAIDITVSPEIIRTDKYLKKLKPSERDCYFDGEKS